jgi:putative addiction module CopG family antidote
MNIALKPQIQQFVEEQVRAGHFRSPEEVLEEAIARMMSDPDVEPDVETMAAITRAEEQFDRGEGIDFDQFAAEMRRKYNIR